MNEITHSFGFVFLPDSDQPASEVRFGKLRIELQRTFVIGERPFNLLLVEVALPRLL